MGRNSKEKVELTTKRVWSYLMDRETTKKRFAVVEQLTDQVLRCRNSARKKQYREQLENAHKVLCSLATDSEEYKTKYFDMKEEHAQAVKKRAEWANQATTLQTKLLEMDRISRSCEQHKQLRQKAEDDCGQLLDEKRKAVDQRDRALEKVDNLQHKLDYALAKIASLKTEQEPSAGD